MSSAVRRLILRWEALLVVLLVLVYALGARLSPYFLSSGNQADAIASQMERALVVLPMVLIIIAGEIDLSVASIAGLASAVLGVLMGAGVPFPLALVFAVIVGCAAGLLNGVLVVHLGLPSMVVTVGTLALFRGMAFILLGGQAVTSFPEWFTTFGFERIPGLPLPWTILLFIALAVGAAVLLHATTFGRRLYALGLRPEVARFSGVPVKRMKVLLYMLSGAVGAVAGIVLTARISSARADNATGWELAIIATVLLGGVSIYGGKGTILGPVLAVFILGGLYNALGLANVSTQLLQIIIGAILIASVLLTNVLFGRARSSRPGAPRRTGGTGEGAAMPPAP
jgi:rhamnose transport system permease protein